MSVLLIDLAVFHAVGDKLISADPHDAHFKSCLQWKASSLEFLVKNWFILNRASYTAIHKNNPLENHLYEYAKREVTTIQFLKLLKYIRTNIDLKSIGLVKLKFEEKYSVEFLDTLIHDIQSRFIESLAEYQDAL